MFCFSSKCLNLHKFRKWKLERTLPENCTCVPCPFAEKFKIKEINDFKLSPVIRAREKQNESAMTSWESLKKGKVDFIQNWYLLRDVNKKQMSFSRCSPSILRFHPSSPLKAPLRSCIIFLSLLFGAVATRRQINGRNTSFLLRESLVLLLSALSALVASLLLADQSARNSAEIVEQWADRVSKCGNIRG